LSISVGREHGCVSVSFGSQRSGRVPGSAVGVAVPSVLLDELDVEVAVAAAEVLPPAEVTIGVTTVGDPSSGASGSGFVVAEGTSVEVAEGDCAVGAVVG
jgi:hypothetical protein